MAGRARGQPRFYTILIDDLKLISTERLEKRCEAYRLILWVKDSVDLGPFRQAPLSPHRES